MRSSTAESTRVAVTSLEIKININGYHDECRGYLEYTVGCLVYCKDTMSTSRGYDDDCGHVGGYHEYMGGCSVHWFVFPTTFPKLVMIPPGVLMISSRCAKHPKCAYDIPHCPHDILRCTPHPWCTARGDWFVSWPTLTSSGLFLFHTDQSI